MTNLHDPHCGLTHGVISLQADLNVSLTALSMLWNASDLVTKLYTKGSDTKTSASMQSLSAASTPVQAATPTAASTPPATLAATLAIDQAVPLSNGAGLPISNGDAVHATLTNPPTSEGSAAGVSPVDHGSTVSAQGTVSMASNESISTSNILKLTSSQYEELVRLLFGALQVDVQITGHVCLQGSMCIIVALMDSSLYCGSSPAVVASNATITVEKPLQLHPYGGHFMLVQNSYGSPKHSCDSHKLALSAC